MLFKVILEGILYGLFLSILIGPLFVTLVDTSIKYGVRKAMFVAAGIWLSDGLFIWSIAYLTLKFEDIIHSRFITQGSWITSIIFIAVGLRYLIVKDSKIQKDKWQFPNNNFWQFWKGFLINTINPFTVVFWTSLAANQVILKDRTSGYTMWFFFAILVVIVLTDTIKVILANRVTYFLQSKSVTYLSYFSGLVFLLSGLYILYKFCL